MSVTGGNEVPMPVPNMETCVFGIQMLKADAEKLQDKFVAILGVGFDESDLATYDKMYNSMEQQYDSWKQKFVTAVAALKEYKTYYEKYIPIFDETQDIFNTGTKLMFNARKTFEPAAPASSEPPTPAARSSISTSNFKLERVKLPTFDGTFSAWEEFRDLFSSAVHNNNTLTPAEKMVYLRTSMTGDALAIIQSFPTTHNAYADAWALVQKRYANPREIAFSHLCKLYEVRRATDSAHDLRKIVDLVNEIVRSLKSQKIPVEHWDVILVFWTLKKLDEETRREWLLTQETALPTLTEFLDFLEKRACALDDSLARTKKPVYHHNDSKKTMNVKLTNEKPTYNSHATTTTTTTSGPTTRGKCFCCDGEFHRLSTCGKFSALSPAERSDLVKRNGMCFNCFSKKHTASSCDSKFSCQRCEKKHHTLLHLDQRVGPTNQAPPSLKSLTPAASDLIQKPQCSFGSARSQHVLLATIQANVLDHKSELHPVRVFVDNGSEVEFVSADLVRRLGLRPYGNPISITGISGVPGPSTYGKVKLTLCSRLNTFSLPIEAEIVDRLTSGALPQVKCQPSFPYLKGIPLADPKFFSPQPVDILLGNRYATRLKSGGLVHGPDGMPSAEDTPFGWILSGELPIAGIGPSVTPYSNAVSVSNHVSEPDLHSLVERFWHTEEPDVPVISRSEEDSYCETVFSLTTSRDTTGRYIVSLPFRESHPPLGESLPVAMRRFHAVERRLHQSDQVRQAYLDYFRSGLKSGIMEVIPTAEIPCPAGKSYYMPFTHVVKENSTSTKCRIVFDCSARTIKGPSLNEILHPGPKLQVDLIPLLVKFRVFPYVLSADIQKFFTQIWVDPSHKDYQRLLFREAPQLPIQHLRFRRVTFGVSPAPYLAIRTLHQLFDDECDDPVVRDLIRSDVLVDNLLTGTFSIPEGLHLQSVLRSVMSKGHFPLCKWASNVESLLTNIPEEERELSSPLLISDPTGIPTLGLTWIPPKDTFTVVIPNVNISASTTKRSVLSSIAKLYDPLGWLTPVTVRAKILLQEIWKSKVNWDEPVPPEIGKKWIKYISELPRLTEFVVPRGYFPNVGQNSYRYELFGFSDASNQAHSAVVYIRRVSESDIDVALVGSKTKVTPLSGETTPRSELNGAKLLSRFMKTVTNALPVKVECIRCYTDSTSVLGWLHTTAKQVKKRDIFVLNRVRAITQSLPTAVWDFVSGTENPADLPSRGISVSEFLFSDLWVNGPPWLKTFITQKCPTTHHVIAAPTNPLLSFINSTSSFPRMKSFVASGRRLLQNVKSKQVDKSPLSPPELEEAEYVIVKAVQQESFPEEIRFLSCGKNPHSKKIKFLAPFLDERGLLRVGGRLSQSQLPYETKHPMLLPKKHHFTDVIIRYLHVKHLHAGSNLLLSILREKYWVFDGPSTVKNIVRRCVVCHKNRPFPLQQIMGHLPQHRVTIPSRPFATTCLDFAGPFILATVPGRKPRLEKHYFCVFVCSAVKAVHLELVGDLSTPSFIAALTRFVSRRGLPRVIVSDGGRNFLGARNEFQELESVLLSSKFQDPVNDYAKEMGIEFQFNPPLAPHHGGLFEAAVKSAKFHLRRIVGDRHLSLEEFGTLLTQVEAALNSRPLLPMSSDPSDYRALTPAHFLIGDTLHSIPSQDLTSVKTNRLKRWEIVQQYSQHFWNRFTQEYLSTLQSRPKWNETFPNIEPGVLVLVQESDAAFSSHKWKLARVVAVHPGPDGKVRVVDIKTSQGKTFRRSIARIAPLPVEHQPILDEVKLAPNPSDSSQGPPGRCSEEKNKSTT